MSDTLSTDQKAALRADVLAVVPQNWLHPLLTGPRAVITMDAITPRQVETLCNEIRGELSRVLSAHGIEVKKR